MKLTQSVIELGLDLIVALSMFRAPWALHFPHVGLLLSCTHYKAWSVRHVSQFSSSGLRIQRAYISVPKGGSLSMLLPLLQNQTAVVSYLSVPRMQEGFLSSAAYSLDWGRLVFSCLQIGISLNAPLLPSASDCCCLVLGARLGMYVGEQRGGRGDSILFSASAFGLKQPLLAKASERISFESRFSSPVADRHYLILSTRSRAQRVFAHFSHSVLRFRHALHTYD